MCGIPRAGALITEVVWMKGLILQLLLLLVAASAVVATDDNIIITQVLYDPLATDSGGEAVELYNPTANSIDISGWLVSTETSISDATLPGGTILGSGQYYLVADAGWSSSKDDASWPLADYEEAITLANSDAGVALSNGTAVIDAVGWGNPSNIDAGLYEGMPASVVSNGESLQRIKNSSYTDTNDNSNDFAPATPNFRNSSFGNAQSNTINVVAVVEGSFPAINSFAIVTDDDSFTAGNQIHPVPKNNKTVTVEAVISHSSGAGYLQNVTLTLGGSSYYATATPINSTASLYTASFNMSYADAAGNYTATLLAADNGGFTANKTASFEYTELIAIEVDASTLQFGAMPGMSSEIAGDLDTETGANTTVQNIGNSALNIQLSGTNLSSGSGVIPAESIAYTLDGNYNSSLSGMLSYAPVTKNTGMEAASRLPVSFRLSVPVATAPGNYTGTITLVAVKS